MIVPDTNIIVRLLTRDDENQFQKAFTVFQKESLFIPTTVILETEWVLRYAYAFAPNEVAHALGQLFGLPNVEIEDPLKVAKALEWHLEGIDFADALHLTSCGKVDQFITFDKKLISEAQRVTGLEVGSP